MRSTQVAYLSCTLCVAYRSQMEEGTSYASLYSEPKWFGTSNHLGTEPAETNEREVSRVQLRRRFSRRRRLACAIGLVCFIGWLGRDLSQVRSDDRMRLG